MVTRKVKIVTRNMGRLKLIVVLLLSNLVLPQVSFSQDILVVGQVIDEEGDFLIGCTVEINQKHCITNESGGFEINLPVSGFYKTIISYMGYETYAKTLNADSLGVLKQVVLRKNRNSIDEVEVRGNPVMVKKRNYSIPIQLINEEFLKESRAGNLVQSLDKVPGVNSMDIGTGMSKPVIRGLGFYRVLMAENGIKQEGQYWSNHHGVVVDPFGVEHVEIIKGAGAIEYGSGAIGGVINVLPGHVPILQGVEGEMCIFTKSNNRAIGGNGNITVRKGDVYIQGSLSVNYSGDFRVPADSFLIPNASSLINENASHKYALGETVFNTAGKEESGSLLLGLVKPWGVSYIETSLIDNCSGFFDWSFAGSADFVSGHNQSYRDIKEPSQHVSHFSLSGFSKIYTKSGNIDLGISFQNNVSAEHAYLVDITGNRADDAVYYREKDNLDNWLGLKALSGRLSYSNKTAGRGNYSIGASGSAARQRTDGFNHILPDYTTENIGVFGHVDAKVFQTTTICFGARADFSQMNIDESINPDPELLEEYYNRQINNDFAIATYSFGIRNQTTDKLTMKVNLGKGFRLPSVYELAANGLHRHDAMYVRGDSSLNTEISWQFDSEIEYQGDRFILSISPFLNYFSNYIYLQPTSEFEQGSFTGQVYQYGQNEAMLTGSELSSTFNISRLLSLNVAAEYVYAVNLDLSSALPSTPPASVIVDLKYQCRDMKVLKKPTFIVSGAKVFDQVYVVQYEMDTPGYCRFDVTAKTGISLGETNIEAMLKIDNVFNTKYYNHLSFYRRMRIPEPGRNIQLYINIPFQFKSKKNKRAVRAQ